MGEAFEEADLRAGLNKGGAVVGAFIVERTASKGFVVYLRTDWVRGRGFRLIQTWRAHQGDRLFKSVDVALRFIRRYGFTGRVTIYPAGDPELRLFAGVSPTDNPGGDRISEPDAQPD